MNLWFRLLWCYLSYRSRGKNNFSEMSKRNFRVWPTDLDIFNHMNNAKFLALCDLGRFDWLLRSGIWPEFKKRNWYPVVVAETITFRKSLTPFMLFSIENKFLGWDDEAAFIEQRFVVKGEIYAKAVVKVRYLINPRGILTPHQVIEGLGGWNGPEPKLPEWVKRWNQDTKLPKGKEPAPSVWLGE
jgi:acyl-CoA thioesterase FadM